MEIFYVSIIGQSAKRENAMEKGLKVELGSCLCAEPFSKLYLSIS